MKLKKILNMVVCLGLLMGASGLLYPNPAGAFSGITIDPRWVEFVETNSTIMEVNLQKSYMVVGEIKYDITEFKISGRIYNTVLVNANGDKAPLKSFKKGQRVIVKSIKLPGGVLVAGFIQKVEPGYKTPKKYRFIPKAPSIK